MTKPKWPCLSPIEVKCSCGCGTSIFRDKYEIKRHPKSFVNGHSFYRERNCNWKGGIRRASGYIHILSPSHPNAAKNGYVREHILVMSRKINRPIEKDEVVHHINGIKDDNRIENLILMKRTDHTSHHHKGIKNPKKAIHKN